MSEIIESPIAADKKLTKTSLAKQLGVSRQSLYYVPIKPIRDIAIKMEIESVLSFHSAYGHKRVVLELEINKKKALKAMKKFSLKPYKKSIKRPRKINDLNRPSTVY